ncbi:hypothetical protein TRFO_06688 [Tritrichomonas foetus]|uniref:Uncharacterized protein n=1 Tax=Tritrichomonas foetus TaxID=1144522 RepID=A0A1J4K123_9EUKA|nr:hypothetical protein TRFO_06688 [Tritrichomonas foetus]|eukprot:OHT03444.1 hypothetical protein TRFO_06688 [Tritrichomonas foetus]
MDFSYKETNILKNESSRLIQSEENMTEEEKKQINDTRNRFNFHVANIHDFFAHVQSAKNDRNKAIIELTAEIRAFSLFLKSQHAQIYLPTSLFEEGKKLLQHELIPLICELISNECDSPVSNTQIFISFINLFRCLLYFFKPPHPIYLFLQTNLKKTLIYLISREIPRVTDSILGFLVYLIDGSEIASNFIFSIVSIDQLKTIVYSNFGKNKKDYKSIDCCDSSVFFIFGFSRFFIPLEKIEELFSFLLYLRQYGKKTSFKLIYKSLRNFIRMHKEQIKMLFEQNKNLKDFMIYDSKLDSKGTRRAVIDLLKTMCDFHYKMENYPISLCYDSLFDPEVGVRKKCSEFWNSAYSNNYENIIMLMTKDNFIAVVNRLMELIFAEYKVALEAGKAILILFFFIPASEYMEIIKVNGFNVFRKIFEASTGEYFENVMKIFNMIFISAVNQGWVRNCILCFEQSDCINCLNERLEQCNEKQAQLIEAFMTNFNQQKENLEGQKVQ